MFLVHWFERRGRHRRSTAAVGLVLLLAGSGRGQGVIVLEGGGNGLEARGQAQVTIRVEVREGQVAGRDHAPVAELDEPAFAEPEAERRLGELLLDGLRRAVPAAVADAAFGAPADIARREAIAENTRTLEQEMTPLLHAELEHVRRTCGRLAPAARREVLAAGRRALRELAAADAVALLDGRTTPRVSAREELHARLAAAVRQRAEAAEFARYEHEAGLRRARRREHACVRMVGDVDARLDLSSSQRDAMLADLRGRWQPAWDRGLDVPDGMQVPLAPDFATECIAPHLDEAQREAWRRWCEEFGIDRIGWRPSRGGGQQEAPPPGAWWNQ